MARTIDTLVVGVTFENDDGGSRQEIIEMLSEGDELVLEREFDNGYDENAIAVFDEFYAQIGYINKELASELAPLMDAGQRVKGSVSEIIEDVDSFGCRMKLTLFSLEESDRMLEKQFNDTYKSVPINQSKKTTSSSDDKVNQFVIGCVFFIVLMLIIFFFVIMD